MHSKTIAKGLALAFVAALALATPSAPASTGPVCDGM